MPQAWKDALDAAVKAGKIPDIPPSISTGGNPTYPDGLDPMSDEVCSATYKCRNPDDVWDAPDGHVGIGFDDGPEAVRDNPTLSACTLKSDRHAGHHQARSIFDRAR